MPPHAIPCPRLGQNRHRLELGRKGVLDGHKRGNHGRVQLRQPAEGIAGATVLHGIEGYGPSRRIHTSRILDLSQDLPVVIIAIVAFLRHEMRRSRTDRSGAAGDGEIQAAPSSTDPEMKRNTLTHAAEAAAEDNGHASRRLR